MSYTFEAFLGKQPYQFYLSRFEDKEKERGVFSACWRSQDFASLVDFQVFLFQYSSLLQPYIHELRGEDLSAFFKVEANAEQSARSFHSQHRELTVDAQRWGAKRLSFADFSWLNPGEFTTVMEFKIDGYTEMVARGPAGFMTVFVADLIE